MFMSTRGRRFCSLIALLFVATAACLPAINSRDDDKQPATIQPRSPNSNSRTSVGKSPEQLSVISFKDGRLSVQVENQPLPRVLDKVSRQTGVGFMIGDGLEEPRISVAFQNLRLEEGIQQILKDQDAFFFYGAEEQGSTRLRGIWVYPRGGGRRLAPLPPEEWASTKEVEQRLADPDPDVRSRAVEVLVERKGKLAVDAVLRGLKDDDEQVRTRSLYAAVRANLALPVDYLSDLALHNASTNIRFLALSGLEELPAGKEIAKRALADPSPHVRGKAREILGVKRRAYGE